MRTFTVVPSFEGQTAFFELPDIGFQGDHLSFAILFNLTELTEHWPNIVPSMIVTDPRGNTFIAPATSWNAVSHIFTWTVSSSETAYEGVVRCQLKCTAEDDPNTIVCMSRICQTRVYPSLAAAEDPPEAFQSWLDMLVQLQAEIAQDASDAINSVEATQTNARTAQSAAESAIAARNAALDAQEAAEDAVDDAQAAQLAAEQAQRRAASSATDAETSRQAAATALEAAQDALEEIDASLDTAATHAQTATDAATQAATSMANANTARQAAEQARDAAITARTSAETARDRAETAEDGAESAKNAAIRAQGLAESAQTAAAASQLAAETARTGAEAAQSAAEDAQAAAEAAVSEAETASDNAVEYSELSKKWATGYDFHGNEVYPVDPTYENNARHWASIAAAEASVVLGYGLYVDEEGNGYIRSTDDIRMTDELRDAIIDALDITGASDTEIIRLI